VIIRPPLVYGPGARANFQALVRAVAWGIPLPLGAVRNRRSLIAVDNLVDFIVTCMEHPLAANEIFLVSDDQDLSTADLVRGVARAMGRHPRLFPLPTSWLIGMATLLGCRDVARRVLGSLQIDMSKARQRLAWTPPVGVDEALRRAVAVPR
jgi:nucleoside-diphosphate-sugar epimerase